MTALAGLGHANAAGHGVHSVAWGRLKWPAGQGVGSAVVVGQ
jgi:hypothetical protein